MKKKGVIGISLIIVGFIYRMFSILIIINLFNISFDNYQEFISQPVSLINALIPLFLAFYGAFLITKSYKIKDKAKRKTGVTRIYLGVGVLFVIPFLIFNLADNIFSLGIMDYAAEMSITPVISILIHVLGIFFIVFGIVTLKSSQKDKTVEKEIVAAESNQNHNKIVNVSLWGGLLGIFSDSPKDRLTRAIKRENTAGYRVVQIEKGRSGSFLLYLLRLIILLLTIFIYTPSNGYYISFEKIDNGRI